MALPGPFTGRWLRPKRWADAVDQFRTLQVEYEAWRDQLPEALADSRTAEHYSRVSATSTSRPSTSSCRGGSVATEGQTP